MNNNNDIVGTTKGTSTLTRARFGPGMLLQHGDLEQLNNYTRDLSRLLFRSFFGCGVICGLTVDGTEDCGRLKVTVQPGVALTCGGDPVYVPPGVEAIWTRESFKMEGAMDVWVKLCRKTKCCSPRVTTCSSDDDEATSDCTREAEGYQIHVQTERPGCACACPETPATDLQRSIYVPEANSVDPCHTDHYEGLCGCTCGECFECDCECVLLAKLSRMGNPAKWLPDHGVRRFIRPAMITDPQLRYDKDRMDKLNTATLVDTPLAEAKVTTAKVKKRVTK
jgi:hypothetical protein